MSLQLTPVFGLEVFVLTKKSKSHTMRHCGAWCIVIGITTIAIGVTCGVGSIITGGNLLAKAE